MTESFVEVLELSKHFPIRSGWFQKATLKIKAVDGVSFSIAPGETLAVVGESGSGKTTLGRAMLRLTQPTAGTVSVEGVDIASIGGRELLDVRRKLQIIFQDPYSSLDPRLPIGASVAEGPAIHHMGSRTEQRERVIIALRRVGLDEHQMARFPHEFSGGQRQRIGIARAIAVEPKLIVADEPVSALDVSVQAQILNLMRTLQEELGLAYVFIVHDLGVVNFMADRVLVMYFGRIVEQASRKDLFSSPAHPYTAALLSAVPMTKPRLRRTRIVLKGEIPDPLAPPSGCHFHPRCWLREKLGNPSRCSTEAPSLLPASVGSDRLVACHYASDVS